MPDHEGGEDRGFGRPASARQWASLVAGLLPLVAVAVFVLQNTDKVKVSFLLFDGRIALGLALLLAAVPGRGGCRLPQFRAPPPPQLTRRGVHAKKAGPKARHPRNL